jgi:hypothetical protein
MCLGRRDVGVASRLGVIAVHGAVAAHRIGCETEGEREGEREGVRARDSRHGVRVHGDSICAGGSFNYLIEKGKWSWALEQRKGSEERRWRWAWDESGP